MNGEGSLLPPRVAGPLVLVAALGVAGVIGVLIDQNLALKRALASRAPSPGIEAGSHLPDIQLIDPSGEPHALHALVEQTPLLLGFMTTTCPTCEQNLPQWDRLTARLRSSAFAIVSFDPPEATSRYVQSHGLTWVVWRIDPSAARAARITHVPTTLVIGERGAVIYAKSGVLSDADLDTIVKYLPDGVSGARSSNP